MADRAFARTVLEGRHDPWWCSVAVGEDEATFEYLGRTREHAVVRFLRSPEDAAPQGRTQVYQAIRRPHRRPSEEAEGSGGVQMRLFDKMTEEFLEVGGMMVGEEDQE